MGMLVYRRVFRFSPYSLGACGIIVAAIVIRIMLIALGWPLLDSDEGTMGLMAMHIAYRGEHPVFFYGQGYMGATEAYLASFMFHFFGISSFALRLGLILIFTIFLISMYLLTSLLYSKKLALVILAFLALGSNPVLVRELVAVGGDPEILMSSAILMLLVSWLALTSHSGDKVLFNHPYRLFAYGFWGLVAGFSIFSHELGVPFIALGGLILLMFCWREIKSWAPVCLLVGLLISSSPIIIYNLTAPPDQSTLFYVIHAISAGGVKPHWLSQINGALFISLPTATGANPLCSVADVNRLNFWTLQTWHCSLVHIAWPIGFLLLGGCAFVMAILALWRYRPSEQPEKRQEFIRNVIRLSLLIAGAITLLLYIVSPNSALYPVATSRYLINLLIVTPAVLWPLWYGVSNVKPRTLSILSSVTFAVKFSRLSFIVRRGILLLVGGILLLGTVSTFIGIPAQPPGKPREDVYFTQLSSQHLDMPAVGLLDQSEQDLIQYLSRLGATHIYSDYWTCNRLIFQSQEHIICAVLNDTLGIGHNRYKPYLTIVKSDPKTVYVFHVNNQQDTLFERRPAGLVQYQRSVFDGYAIYHLLS